MQFRTPTHVPLLTWHDLTADEQEYVDHDNGEYLRYCGEVLSLADFSRLGCPCGWDGAAIQSPSEMIVIRMLDCGERVRITTATVS
jgi:hypothetical protein